MYVRSVLRGFIGRWASHFYVIQKYLHAKLRRKFHRATTRNDVVRDEVLGNNEYEYVALDVWSK